MNLAKLVSVCMCVIKFVIVDAAQRVKVLVFLYEIESVCMVLRILNLGGHENCMICFKVTTTLTLFFVHH